MSKIIYNIDNSNYAIATENFVFYFSSVLYLKKFVERHLRNRIDLGFKLSSRFNITLHAPDYFDFILYSEIEKRGFRVIDKRGERFTCLKETILNGEIKTLRNSKG